MERVMRVDLSQRAETLAQLSVPKFHSRKYEPEQISSFDELLKESLANVNSLQKVADKETQRLTLGEVEDISQVVSAVSQAELALRLVVQIRNKLVDAYQQIGRMAL